MSDEDEVVYKDDNIDELLRQMNATATESAEDKKARDELIKKHEREFPEYFKKRQRDVDELIARLNTNND